MCKCFCLKFIKIIIRTINNVVINVKEGSRGRRGGGGKVRVMTKMLKLEAIEVLSWSNEHFFVYYIRCEVYRIRIAFRRLNFVLL